jgi:cell division protein ZipA
LDIKDLILIGGGLLIAAVVAHGLWIAWRAKRDPLRLKIDEKLIAAVADRDPAQADFPNGGARVVSRWDDPTEPADAVSGPADRDAIRIAEQRAAGGAVARDRGNAERAPQERAPQERAPQERRAPSLGAAQSRAARAEPLLPPARGQHEDSVAATSATDDWAAGESTAQTLAEIAVREAAVEQAGTREPRKVEPTAGGVPPHLDGGVELRASDTAREGRNEIRTGEAAAAKGEGLRAGVARRAQEAFKAFGNKPAPRASAGPARGAAGGAATGNGSQPAAAAPAETQPDDLILINVLAPREQPFTGPKLVEALRANGLRYGDMNIFHRIDPVTKTHQYSIANIIEPGTFDMAEVDEFRTPGVCFFMQLPGPEQPVEAFEDMHRVARDVAQRLGGEMKDERRSVLTGQTVEHYRHRVAEFCRRRMSMRA